MKKILSILLLSFIIIGLYIPNSNAKSESKTYFRVTAYYSPLPAQKYYIKGNYLAEKRMNWEWIRWASGKGVFSWMLAAPSKYNFWTKIYLKWLWVWEVADRGWAIVKAWERNFKYDRIDVWVGYGDEWLRRAMYWGNRVIEWNIVENTSNITLNYKEIPSPIWAIPKTKQNSIYQKIKNIIKKTDFELMLEKELKIFSKKIENTDQTKILQEKLINLWLYDWEIDWNYDNIKNIISNYQLEKKLIKHIWDIWTWYFWPKTRKSLKNDYKKLLENQEIERQKIIKFEENIKALKQESEKKAKTILNNIWSVKFGEISHWVRELQIALKKLWYFEYKDTAIFGNKTKQALIDYQLDKKVIANVYVPWSWHFWPNTKKQILNDLANMILWEQIQEDKNLTEYYINKKSEVAKIIQKNKEI